IGLVFSPGASQPQCARAALRTILDNDSPGSRYYRWVSLLMLDGLDAASGRAVDTAHVFRRGTTDIPRWPLYALRAAAGLGPAKAVRRAVDSLAPSYRTLNTGQLWYVALGASTLRDTSTLLLVQREAVARADSSRTRLDRFVASLISPHVRLL